MMTKYTSARDITHQLDATASSECLLTASEVRWHIHREIYGAEQGTMREPVQLDSHLGHGEGRWANSVDVPPAGVADYRNRPHQRHVDLSEDLSSLQDPPVPARRCQAADDMVQDDVGAGQGIDLSPNDIEASTAVAVRDANHESAMRSSLRALTVRLNLRSATGKLDRHSPVAAARVARRPRLLP